MQINISGHHLEVTNALHDYVVGKFDRLDRHSDLITSSSVTLSIEKTRHKADASLHVTGSSLVASSESGNMYAAIDLLADKLDRQLLKYKEKSTSNNHGLR
ncbi:putative sigma-54 modulation protein [Sinobacterium caligoides]|uniref:Ribosome hibernation promoting factor n=1 Tax=Sinobacterium caligoides TaxID=933926 RepID=A0A3N2E3F0_9GAMM|nr:ribosome-associated translation inhibitor RaiA [Sinobacterium caligoides]ROS06115.1 putative sigma-54 modulation protein [Sinobacterium caligoides]